MPPRAPWSGPTIIISNGPYLHINDPSVQKLSEDFWVMAYTTEAIIGGLPRGWINVSISPDGGAWYPPIADPSTEVRIANATFSDISRPAIIVLPDRVRMWFDAYINDADPHSYLAESYPSDPLLFHVVHQYPDTTGGRPGFFEPDVELVATGDPVHPHQYVALVNPDFFRIDKMSSYDGIVFQLEGTVVTAAEPTLGAERIHNPGLIYDNFDGTTAGMRGLAYGYGPSSLMSNDIGFAYFQHRVEVLSCPSTLHVHQYGRYFEQAVIRTYAFPSYCQMSVFDSVSGALLLSQPVTSVRGDQWVFLP